MMFDLYALNSNLSTKHTTYLNIMVDKLVIWLYSSNIKQ